LTPSVLYQNSTSGDFFTTDLFFHISNSSNEPTIIPDITIINIDSLISRKEIAYLLSNVLKMNPRKIGVDIAFHMNKDQDDSLIVKIVNEQRLMKKCVFANDYYIDDNSELPSVSHSFCLNKKDSLIEGFANFIYDETFMNVRQYRSTKYTSEGEILSLTSRMIDYQERTSANSDNHIEIIDYRLSSFNEINANELDRELINNHYVLIGSLSRSHDNYNTPIGMMPGLKIHAYTLKTALSQNKIHSVNKIWEWFILIFICIFSSIGLVFADYSVLNSTNKMQSVIVQEGVWAFIIVFLQVSFLLLIAYLLLEYFDLVFSMQSSLNSALFVAAIVKSIYTIILTFLSKKGIAKSILNRLMYYSIK
jgi:CHASE2 domain-containing sensor protein